MTVTDVHLPSAVIGPAKGSDTPSRATPPSRYAHLHLPTLYNYGSLDVAADLLSVGTAFAGKFLLSLRRIVPIVLGVGENSGLTRFPLSAVIFSIINFLLLILLSTFV